MTSGAAACERSSRRRRSTRTRWAPSNRCDAPAQPLPGACVGAGRQVRVHLSCRLWGPAERPGCSLCFVFLCLSSSLAVCIFHRLVSLFVCLSFSHCVCSPCVSTVVFDFLFFSFPLAFAFLTASLRFNYYSIQFTHFTHIILWL